MEPSRYTLLYYLYVPLRRAGESDARHDVASFFADQAAAHGLVGRVRVARDGINATLGSSSLAQLERHCEAVRRCSLLGDGAAQIDFKVAPSFGARSAAAIPGCRFNAFEVKLCDEIVTMNVPPGVAEPRNTGAHLAPRDFHRALAQAEGTAPVLIDVRNHYEHAIGRFAPPAGVELILPHVRTYSEFPLFLDSIAERLRGREIFMYCTGGVRCERASAYLREKGAGFERVSQLSGGVQRYLEAAEAGQLEEDSGVTYEVALAAASVPALTVACVSAQSQSLWAGKLFVFDERRPVRVAAGTALPVASYAPSLAVLGRCVLCSAPHDEYEWLRCGVCSVLVLVCDSCNAAGRTTAPAQVSALRCDACAEAETRAGAAAAAAAAAIDRPADADAEKRERELASAAAAVKRRRERDARASLWRVRGGLASSLPVALLFAVFLLFSAADATATAAASAMLALETCGGSLPPAVPHHALVASLLSRAADGSSGASALLVCLVRHDFPLALPGRDGGAPDDDDGGAKLLVEASALKQLAISEALLSRGSLSLNGAPAYGVTTALHAAANSHSFASNVARLLVVRRPTAAAALRFVGSLAAIANAVAASDASLGSASAGALRELLRDSHLVRVVNSSGTSILEIELQTESIDPTPADLVGTSDGTATAPATILRTAAVAPLAVLAKAASTHLVRRLLTAPYELAANESAGATSVLALIQSRDDNGRTALHLAATAGNTAAVTALLRALLRAARLQQDAGSARRTLRALIQAREFGGQNATQMACAFGADTVAALLDEAFVTGRAPPPLASTKGVDAESPLLPLKTAPCAWLVAAAHKAAALPPERSEKPSTFTGGWDRSDIASEDEARFLGATAAAGLAAARRIANARPAACDIAEVDAHSSASVDASALYDQFISASRPVILRGLARNWPQRTAWTREVLLHAGRGGSGALSISDIPYLCSFGGCANGSGVVRASLRDFILAMPNATGGVSSPAPLLTRISALAQRGTPAYAFESPDAASRTLLFGGSDGPLTGGRLPSFLHLRRPIPGFEEAAGAGAAPAVLVLVALQEGMIGGLSVAPQFFLGGPGTGSPFHYHHSAYNALIFGEKRWFLLPPRSAVYSTVPSAERVSASEGEARSDALQCTQHATDVMLVPDGWAHSTLNMRTSIGFAGEFVAGLMR